MLERLALAFIIGATAGYLLARKRNSDEGREQFNALMSALPWFAIDGIEDYLNDAPMLTQSIRED